jgi:O-methyltransferase involved in polyketide biosynthesis
MTELSEVDGNILDGVSATTLWTLHNRGTEAKRSDGVFRDPWAVTPLDRVGVLRRIRPGITLLEFRS